MRYFSMFSGIGGFELGIKKTTEWECIGFSEIDKYAIQIYEKHFRGQKNYGDATKIKPKELPDFDLLCGGFPCQSFSIAGKRMGFEDTRGTLFFDIARIAKVKQPQFLFLENVRGLLSHDSGRTFAYILAALDELGYNVEWQVLNSKHFGVPQNRERVFIIGHLRGTSSRQVFPIGEGNLISKEKKRGERKEEQRICGTIDSRYGAIRNTGETYIVQLNKPHHSNDQVYSPEGLSPSLNTMQGGNRQPFITSHSPRCGNPRRGGTGVLECAEHSFTIDSTPHLVNGIRKLTPTECERLQGFPDGWTRGISDTQRYKCLGNAVTVNVIEAVSKKLLETLE